MATTVLIDEQHLGLRLPADIPDGRAVQVYRTLTAARFRQKLRRAIRGVIVQHPELVPVSFTLSR